tara:strand:+ start:932 stop:1294 length:363 start_codon:yes stop_codon:yes gene_type:complete
MKQKDNEVYSTHARSKTSGESENSTSNSEVEYEWGKHPNSQKAVKKHQFKKGQVANPLGRKPQSEKLKENLMSMADEIQYDYSNKPMGTLKELVLKRIWNDARHGDMKKIQLLAWLGCLD